MNEDTNTQDTLTFLKDQLEHYKLDNALLIIPSSKDSKKDIINNININEHSNNIRIIQSSKDSDSNLILEISPTQNKVLEEISESKFKLLLISKVLNVYPIFVTVKSGIFTISFLLVRFNPLSFFQRIL